MALGGEPRGHGARLTIESAALASYCAPLPTLRGVFHRPDINLRCKRAVHGTFVGDLKEPLALLFAQIALKSNGAIDAIEQSFLRLAVGAILCVDPGVMKAHSEAVERQRLALGIKAQGHGRARPKPGKHEVIGPKSAVEPARCDRLVGKNPVPARPDFLLEPSSSGFPHLDAHLASCVRRHQWHRPGSVRPRRG